MNKKRKFINEPVILKKRGSWMMLLGLLLLLFLIFLLTFMYGSMLLASKEDEIMGMNDNEI
jgi:uncharacterized membrane protein YqiK